MYLRPEYAVLMKRLAESRRFMQVILGPRQVGKTTVIRQVLQDLTVANSFFSADMAAGSQATWISQQWQTARLMMQSQHLSEYVLVFDEIQKIPHWSDAVKKEWDADTFAGRNIKVVLLGSSRVLIEKGLSESMAGRFEQIRMTHWTYPEMREAFGFSLAQWLYFGGYPGAASLIDDEDRFSSYINGAIIDATINKDILLDSPVSKPALLRQTFELGCLYSGEILSMTKLLGQLQDTGNTTTLSGYLQRLSDSGLLCGLQKYSSDASRRRASIPKFQVYNNALNTAIKHLDFEGVRQKKDIWGRIAESGIGAYLVSQSFARQFDLFYWREKSWEVDFIMKYRGKLIALEVKTNDESRSRGLEVFQEKFQPDGAYIIGPAGIPFETFLTMDLRELVA